MAMPQWFCCGMKEVDTGCHFYRWVLQRLLPHVGQHSRQGHPCCSVVSELHSQTHTFGQVEMIFVPFGAVSYPQRAQDRQKTKGGLPILCLECEVLILQIPWKKPSSCSLDVAVALGFGGSLQAACQGLAGGKHSLLCTTTTPPTKTPLSLGCSAGLPTGSSPTHAGSLLCRFPFSVGTATLCFSSTSESLICSPSAIESWAFAYLIRGLFSETYLCWNTAFLLSSLIYIELLWASPALLCVTSVHCWLLYPDFSGWVRKRWWQVL